MAENTSKSSSLYDHYEFLTVPQKAAVEFAWQAQHPDVKPMSDQLRDFGERAIQKHELQAIMEAYDRHQDEKWASHRHLLQEGVTHPMSFMDFALDVREAVWREHEKRADGFVPDPNISYPVSGHEFAADIQRAKFRDQQSHAILTDPELVERITLEYKRDAEAGRLASIERQQAAALPQASRASHDDAGDDDDLAVEAAAREESAADREAIASERAADSPAAPDTPSWAGKARKKTPGAAVPVMR